MPLKTYFTETMSELRQVRWPTRAETLRLTLIVIAISALVGAYVGGLDYFFTNILKFILK